MGPNVSHAKTPAWRVDVEAALWSQRKELGYRQGTQKRLHTAG